MDALRHRRLPPAVAHQASDRGFSLMEALVGSLIAVLAIVGLAYSFGTGRGLVNRYETGRIALAAAQSRLEILKTRRFYSADLQLGDHGPDTVRVDGRDVAFSRWTVSAYDDPQNGTGEVDLKQVTVTVQWGGLTEAETVRLNSLVLPR